MDLEPLWSPWIGLPHAIGADPREGKAACCLVMAKILLEHNGYRLPEIEPWLDAARAGDWISLAQIFDEYCEPIPDPVPYSLTLFRNGTDGLGVGTVVKPNLVIFPHHRKGVITLPIDRLRLMQFRRLKQ